MRELVEVEGYTGIAELAKKLSASGCVLPSRKTVRRWALGRSSPFSGKRIFMPRPSEELSFFLGAWIGDGWGDVNDGGKRMLLKVRSYDFAKEFAECAAKILGKTDSYWVRRVVDKRGCWYLVKVTSFMLYEFVNQPVEILHNVVEHCPRGFLRGFFTAEGNPSVSISQRNGPRLDIGISVSNSDYKLLEFCSSLLLALGFKPGRIRLTMLEGTRTNLGVATKPGWQIALSKLEDIRKFATVIGFADSKKQLKLVDSIQFLDEYGRKGAAVEWKRLYEMRHGTWVRRGVLPSSSLLSLFHIEVNRPRPVPAPS